MRIRGADTKAKSLMLRYPDDVSEASVFGRFLTTLVSRYSGSRPVLDAVVDFIEVCNEPNDMWWPQQAPSAAPANPCATSTDTRRRLAGRWRGWPAADAANPPILLTEGGVTPPNIAARWGITDPAAQRAKQADLPQRNWNRMVTTGEGAGIAMLGYYLWYTDPNYDCGLCDTAEAGGATRPAYPTWKAMPSFQ